MKRGVMPRLTQPPAKSLVERSHRRYKEILAPIPEFEGGRFLVNILSGAMFPACSAGARTKVQPLGPSMVSAAVRCCAVWIFLPFNKLFKKLFLFTGGRKSSLHSYVSAGGDTASENFGIWR